MKLCTCLNCHNVWYDMNANNDQIDYVEDPDIEPLEIFYEDGANPESAFWGCPVCKDDGQLVDNADMTIQGIINRKKTGIDCTEQQSAELKRFLKDVKRIHTGDVQLSAEIAHHFPIEFGEAFDEME